MNPILIPIPKDIPTEFAPLINHINSSGQFLGIITPHLCPNCHKSLPENNLCDCINEEINKRIEIVPE